MIRNPFAGYNLNNPFGSDAMKRTRNLFGVHTTPREWKHGARDIPFGMGAASLHVDGTNGNDANDGESWVTAKKTIQGAVDVADSWTQIFIKAGTYAENVSITKDSVHLIGQSRDTVDIHPASNDALTISGDRNIVTNLSLYSPANVQCAVVSGTDCILDIIKLDGAATSYGIRCATGCTVVALRRIYDSSAGHGYAISALGNAELIEISHCIISVFGAFGINLNTITKSKIFENDVDSMYIHAGSSNNTIFHNNFTSDPQDFGTNNSFFENYYAGHSNVNNGSGIATEPSILYDNVDLRPVVVRNGWNSLSILRSLLRKKTAAQTTQAATDANGTAWVDLKTIAPTTSDIELYQLKMTVAGSWAGNAKYRIIVGSTKVYPFPADKNITSGTLESLIFPVNIQINETAKLQFRSDNAGDGAGDTVTLDQLDYALVL